ncbi:ABC transporter substrate-binding protein [Orrella dioscoreae]
MRRWTQAMYAGLGAAVLALAGCSPDTPINSPYPSGAESENTLYSAFTQRSPKYLDPASSYSSDETPYTYNIYEPLYGYHYLKRPYELVPRAAAALATPRYVDAQGNPLPDDAPGEQIAESVYDIPIRPGIQFQPHPVFARDEQGGHVYYPLPPDGLEGRYDIPDFERTGTRELTAHDYVYAIRRLASPRVVSPIYGVMAEHIVGMGDYGKALRTRDAALRKGVPAGQRDLPWLDLREGGFDGVSALDDHTLRIRVIGKYPQFKYWLAMTFMAPIPWEADRFYSQPGMAERNLSLNTWPVGTGPFMLAESRQNERHVLARNPNFRGEPYPCEGEPGDREAGLLDDCGKPMPFLDRVVFSIEKEAIPLQGKFLQGYYDIPQVERGEYGVAFLVASGDSAEKAELYAQRGLQLPTTVATASWYMGFNWKDPVVGQGDTPEQQERNRKLRQAISIAFDWEEYVAIFENSQGQVAQGPVPPGVLGYQGGPEGVNRQVYDLKGGQPVRKSIDEAKRLLAEAGYPGGRDEKTGAPLVLHYDAMGGMGASPQFDWMRRKLAQMGVQLDVRSTDYNRFQDKMRRGVAQIFLWGWGADYPDAENFLFLLYGPNAKADGGGENAANYRSPEFDALFEQMRFLDDGPEKEAVIHKMVAITQRDAPWMFGYFPKSGGAYHQWVGNAKPTQMVRNTLQFMKVDPALRAQRTAEWNSPVWWPLPLLALLLALAIWPAWRTLKRRERQTAFGDAAGRQQSGADKA